MRTRSNELGFFNSHPAVITVFNYNFELFGFKFFPGPFLTAINNIVTTDYIVQFDFSIIKNPAILEQLYRFIRIESYLTFATSAHGMQNTLCDGTMACHFYA